MSQPTNLYPLSYKGVRAPTPPNIITKNRRPTPTDSQNVVIGDIWINFPRPPSIGEPWILISLANNVATWVQFAGSLGSFITISGNDNIPISPDGLGNIDIVTDNSTVTFINAAPNTLTLDFGLSNLLIGSDGAGITLAVDNVGLGNGALSALTSGSGNVGIGTSSLINLTTAQANTSVGFQTLSTLTTSSGNSAFGFQALRDVTTGFLNTGIGGGAGREINTGIGNVLVGELSGTHITSGLSNLALGAASLQNLLTGQSNIALGRNSASAYIGAESSNIIIGNSGVVSENNKIRIGTNATHTSAFIAGIDGVNVGSVAKVVTMASDQLGTATITAGSGITVTPGANTITIAASAAAAGASFFGVSAATHLAGGIRYYSPYAFGGNATESQDQMVVPLNGTVSNLYCRVVSNLNTVNGTVTVFKNGVGTALVATITALTTGTFSNLINSVGFVAGDTISFELSQATTGNCIEQISCRFVPA